MREGRLRTGELVLTDVTEADLPVLYEHQLDPEGSRMAAFRPRDREAFMAHWANVLADEAAMKKAIVVDGVVAGNVVSFALEGSGEREVGYWIGREHWGKGIATRALEAFLREETTRPLFAHVAEHNAASIRVLEKCGFTVAGKDDAFATIEGQAVKGIVLLLD